MNRNFRDRIYPAVTNIFHNQDSIANHAIFHISAPIDTIHGKQAIIDTLYKPLHQALDGIHRRDLICIGGNNTYKKDGNWVACLTHYVGNFRQPLWGIAPSSHLVFIRAGEFYCIEDNLITKAYIIIDLPNLLHQIGREIFAHNLGNEITFPAPATQNGILPTPNIQQATKTLAIMEGMFDDLHQFNSEDYSSKNQTGTNGYWHPHMLWYGPGGVGSNYQWDGFIQDHRQSFLHAFPDRKGGNHYCRLADGFYSAASGWPSMHMHFHNDYLGIPANKQKLTLRVMDFYRCNTNQICENWVCLDYLDLLRQTGIDIQKTLISGIPK